MSLCRRFLNAVLLGILLFPTTSYSEKGPYSTFARDAPLAPLEAYYDYIVIGGGTAGCALAATLSQGDLDVLLLERGGLPYGNPSITKVSSALQTLLDNSPSSPSQTFISEDDVINARARVLGGGTTLNGGFYSRASSAYVAGVGWDEKLVNESYEWVEKKVVFEPPMLEWQSAVRDGLLEVGVQPYNGYTFDHIYGTKVGGIIFDQNGDRHTAADLLEYADPTQITLYLNATAHRILFGTQQKKKTRPRANSVVFTDANGNQHTAYLKMDPENEILLSAGAIASPQLLMLSGIGPKDELLAHHINVLVDQPMVGQGMKDNPMNILIVPSPRPVETSLVQVVGITNFGSFIETCSWSDLTGTLAEVITGILGRLQNQTGIPTIVSQEVIVRASEILKSNLNGTRYVGIIVEKIFGPASSDYLKLKSINPADNPFVTFNYFQDPQDLERCVQGMKTIIEVVESKSLSTFRDKPVQALIDLMVALPLNLRPRHVSARYSLEQFCIDTVMTIYHYHGGCQVGRVVDPDYRVLGVDALRVIDASTFYGSPGTNPQATIMMLGRYIGKKILQQRSAQ